LYLGIGEDTVGCGSSEATCQQLDRSEVDPGLAAIDCGLEVLSEPAVAVQPGEGSLDHPAPRQDMKAGGLIGSLDDLNAPFAAPGESRRQLVAGISAIGEDVTQPWEQVADRGQQGRCPIAIPGFRRGRH